MSVTVLTGATVALIAGVALQLWSETVETCVLRGAAVRLRAAGTGVSGADPAIANLLLRRTRMGLGATRLARLVALGVLLPGAVLLVQHWPWAPLAEGESSPVTAGIIYIAGFVALLALVMLVHYWAGRRANAAHEARATGPSWLSDAEMHIPMPLLMAAITWERAFALLDVLPRGLGLLRPEAQLIEQDERLSLRLVKPDAAAPASGEPPRGDRTEAQMIRAIQRLDRTLVREIMRPINQVTAVRLRDTTPKRLLELCRRTGFTRIPCYEDQITSLFGYINLYDLLESDALPTDLHHVISEALFVPEVARVDVVLREMIAARQQVAIVFDEFGGTSGWLSREDILEEIVGEVGDEYERPRRAIVETKDGYLADGGTDLDDLKEAIGLDLPKRNCDTIAGYIYARLGRVPRRGEEIAEKGWHIRIAGLERHRIRKVRLIPPVPEPDEGSTQERSPE